MLKTIRQYGVKGRGRRMPENLIIKSTKAIHLLAATAWGGGALSMQALSFFKFSGSVDAGMIAHIDQCLHFIDTWVVIPGLIGCLLTGLFYSLCTSIGFFKFFWIGYKWLITLCAGFWGLLFWGPWGNKCIDWLAQWELDWPLRFVKAFILPESMWQGAMQLIIILSVCLISSYRPLAWRSLVPGGTVIFLKR